MNRFNRAISFALIFGISGRRHAASGRQLSDDEEYFVPCTSEKAFKCRDGKCIGGDYFCDGFDDCADNSDETSNSCAYKRVSCKELDENNYFENARSFVLLLPEQILGNWTDTIPDFLNQTKWCSDNSMNILHGVRYRQESDVTHCTDIDQPLDLKNDIIFSTRLIIEKKPLHLVSFRDVEDKNDIRSFCRIYSNGMVDITYNKDELPENSESESPVAQDKLANATPEPAGLVEKS